MNTNNIPQHIAVVIDGNRRWAKEKGLPTLEGHRKGYNKVKEIGDYVFGKGIKVFTVWCFSTENWNRSKEEVGYLMALLRDAFIKKEIDDYHNKGIKINVIGQKEKLSLDLQNKIKEAEEFTKNNKKGTLNLAISYGGRAEIVRAVKNIIQDKVLASEVNEEVIRKNLWIKDLPEPELIIRTGGHKRLSGFLSWQSAYSELYFLDKYWPDFGKEDLDKALSYFSDCQRNFGC